MSLFKLFHSSRLFLQSTLILAIFALTACGGDSNDSDPFNSADQAVEQAQLRVLHGSPDAPAVDVLVDGSVVLSNVAYQAGSAFLSLSPGSYTVSLNVAGTSTEAASFPVSLASGDVITAIAANALANLELLAIVEDGSDVSSGTARVNVVHGAAAIPEVDIYVTAPGAALASATLSGVPYKANAILQDVAAGTYQVRITLAGDSTVVYDSGSIELTDGLDVTLVALPSQMGSSPVDLVGLTGDEAAPAFTVINDAAEVRVVHASGDTPNVDVYANGGVVDALTNLPFGAASDYLAIPSGSYTFDVAPTDTSVASSALTINAELERGVSYTVLAIGSLNGSTLESWVLVDERKSTNTDGSLRVLHAVPDTNVDVYVGTPAQELADLSPFASDFAYKTTLGPAALAPATYRIQVAAAGTDVVVIDETTAIPASSVSTAVALTDLDGGFSLLLLNDKRPL